MSPDAKETPLIEPPASLAYGAFAGPLAAAA
jgi:hypothetical protein